ncbi:hypothetical protein PHYPSEUDO_007224 [Phytophthora pseudosyringae]|uniref:Protein kinase domain-containing protein n=1 Tax=Phytophthora pseudosyringae TaxID=221518 RepID=A0A8T1VJQ8_9STRA|nr:hypothetical protein PHYPSEUDO_007224 [Phytophthora pseudosyringae]
MRSSLGVLLALLAVEGSAAQVCSAAAQTLTSSCGSDSCGAYEPCLAYNASDCLGSSSTGSSSNCTVVGDEGCKYKCFRTFGAYNSDPTEFVFLVPFGQRDGSDIYASASNDDVTAIDQLTLSPQTTDVWIQGGGDYQQINRGDVVELALAPNLLTSQSQVTSVSFVATNLSTRISDIPSMVPSAITALSLSNTLLEEFPSHLASLTSLDTLRLNDNYITIVSASISWEKLVVLDLGQNNVASFEGDFPALTELYLSGNNLTEIPPAIFTFQHLTKLTIQNNPLSTRTFTEAQTTFLLGLASLDLVEGDFQSADDCSLSEQRLVGRNNVVVCVSDLSTGSSISVPIVSSGSSSAPSSRISYSLGSTSAESGQSSSGADQTSSLLVVAIVAAFVVLTALIATAIYYWKQHSGGESNGVYNSMHRASSKKRAMTIWNDPDLLELQVNGDDIQDVRVIGSGAFAVVWLVRYRNFELLASKRLREDAVSEPCGVVALVAINRRTS